MHLIKKNSFKQIWLNDRTLFVRSGFVVLQTCRDFGFDLPRFCYHEKLSISGNCRMCLIECDNTIKLLASCAIPVLNNLTIYTHSVRVKRARRYILEFLLSSHPLDCPVCDQGGECDLQDLSMLFGCDRGRFFNEHKRAVEDKDVGPFIKTIMTRCIHCTRCVRFFTEISGFEDLGLSGRGMSMEIGTYINNLFLDELSGNIIDLCPVGALTSKPYNFMARSWELLPTNSIDIFDCIGSNIRIDSYMNKIMRIIPRLNEWINEDWISNKIRFSYDSLFIQRLFFPMLKLYHYFPPYSYLFKHIRINWLLSFYFLFYYLLHKFLYNFEIICGFFLDFETLYFYKKFFNFLGCNNLLISDYNFILNLDFQNQFNFNLNLVELEYLETLFLISTNLRLELPILNVRLRKNFVHKKSKLIIFSFGLGVNYLTFFIKNISNSFFFLFKFFEGKLIISKKIINLINLNLILGFSIFFRFDFALFTFLKNFFYYYLGIQININYLKANLTKTSAFNTSYYLLNKNTRINTLVRKCLNPTKFKGSLQFNLGGSLLKSFYKNDFFHKSFSIFKGSFGDQAYFNSNIVLPTTLFSETNSIFFNVEGICQFLNQAVVGPGSCRNSLDIIKAIYTFYIFKIYKNFYKLNNFIISIFKFFNIIQYYWFVFTYKNLSELNVCLNFFFSKIKIFFFIFF